MIFWPYNSSYRSICCIGFWERTWRHFLTNLSPSIFFAFLSRLISACLFDHHRSIHPIICRSYETICNMFASTIPRRVAVGQSTFFGQNSTSITRRFLSAVTHNIELYKYAICPFCNRVKAFLDYAGLEYSQIEVNPLTKKEIKWWVHHPKSLHGRRWQGSHLSFFKKVQRLQKGTNRQTRWKAASGIGYHCWSSVATRICPRKAGKQMGRIQHDYGRFCNVGAESKMDEIRYRWARVLALSEYMSNAQRFVSRIYVCRNNGQLRYLGKTIDSWLGVAGHVHGSKSCEKWVDKLNSELRVVVVTHASYQN